MNLLFTVLAGDVVFVTIIKTILFARIHNKKLINWIYFDSFRINNSSSTESAKAKKRQNLLTLTIIVLALLTLFVKLFME